MSSTCAQSAALSYRRIGRLRSGIAVGRASIVPAVGGVPSAGTEPSGFRLYCLRIYLQRRCKCGPEDRRRACGDCAGRLAVGQAHEPRTSAPCPIGIGHVRAGISVLRGGVDVKLGIVLVTLTGMVGMA